MLLNEVKILMKNYIESFKPENNYLPEDEKQQHENIKNKFSQLSDEHKIEICEYLDSLYEKSLTLGEKAVLQKSKNEFVKGAAIGAVCGAVGGAFLGGYFAQSFSASSVVHYTGNALGLTVGSGLGAVGLTFFNSTQSAHTDVMHTISRKNRPFYLMGAILQGEGSVSADSIRRIAMLTEEKIKQRAQDTGEVKQEGGLRRRNV